MHESYVITDLETIQIESIICKCSFNIRRETQCDLLIHPASIMSTGMWIPCGEPRIRINSGLNYRVPVSERQIVRFTPLPRPGIRGFACLRRVCPADDRFRTHFPGKGNQAAQPVLLHCGDGLNLRGSRYSFGLDRNN